ncbi:hypothetical protein HRbin27_01689 [bacterium HR27]|nr:hypothetical protein HRbin27_01689 [bacterium HR27]
MDPQNRRAPPLVRQSHHHLPVEPARPQERRIEHVRPVGCRDYHYIGVGLEPVHLDQELIERLLPLVVPDPQPREPLPADRIQLVDEDDRRCLRLRALEQVAHPAGSDSDEHLDELGSADAEERDARFTGHRPRQQRLSGTGRTDQQHTTRQPRSDPVILGGILQKIDDLGEFRLRLLLARHVGERHLRALHVVDPRPRPAEAEDVLLAATQVPPQEHEQPKQENER